MSAIDIFGLLGGNYLQLGIEACSREISADPYGA